MPGQLQESEIAHQFGQMYDHELVRLSAQSGDLSDEARQALADELQKRQLLGLTADDIDPDLAKLRGVGGWLLWFCIAQTIIGPLVLVAATLSVR